MFFSEKKEIKILIGKPGSPREVSIEAFVSKSGCFAIHKRWNSAGWTLTNVSNGLAVFSASNKKLIEEAANKWFAYGRKIRKQYKPKEF
jgi:hypothetical protein